MQAHFVVYRLFFSGNVGEGRKLGGREAKIPTYFLGSGNTSNTKGYLPGNKVVCQ